MSAFFRANGGTSLRGTQGALTRLNPNDMRFVRRLVKPLVRVRLSEANRCGIQQGACGHA